MSKTIDPLLFRFAPWLAARLISWLARCMRIDFVGEEHLRQLWQRRQQVILSFWHDQLLMMVKGYRGPAASVMISASKDGELIARTMTYFGVGAIRGSSTRGGRAAFKAMVALGQEPVDLVFTPDGPKGPRHRIKDGVVQLARVTGRPVVPMAFACSRGYRFRSWDRFLLPFPWGRGVYAFGEPVYFRKGEPLDDFRARVQDAMDALNLRAADYLKEHGCVSV